MTRIMTQYSCLSLAILWGCVAVGAADEPAKAKPDSNPNDPVISGPDDSPKPEIQARRRVYVLHSGLHTILSEGMKNLAADTLKSGLHKRGIDERDLIVLENPFPTATWKSMFPSSALSLFHEFTDPASQPSHDAYVRFHKALQAQNVTRKDEIVWVGHSAGGQVGLSMAHLSRNLWRYPELAKSCSSYPLDMVITLGTPLGSTEVPPEVKLRVYFSPHDRIVRWAPKVGPWVFPFGSKTQVGRVPVELATNNCKVRLFEEVDHPSWDVQDRVLDRIVRETRPDARPLWQSQLAVPRAGLSLSQLLCAAVEEHLHISLEDPPLAK